MGKKMMQNEKVEIMSCDVKVYYKTHYFYYGDNILGSITSQFEKF